MADSTKELKQRARKLRELARQAEKAAGGKEDVHREKMAEKSRARSRERREVGPLPPVRDPGRRARCERDLELFARTYFPNRFPWPFAACHRDSIDRMQTCTHEGGQFAVAMPRGSGKTTLGEVEVIRAVVYGFRRFVVLLKGDRTARGAIAPQDSTRTRNEPAARRRLPGSLLSDSGTRTDPQSRQRADARRHADADRMERAQHYLPEKNTLRK